MLASQAVIYEYKPPKKRKTKKELPFAILFALLILVLSLSVHFHGKTYAEAGAGGGAGSPPIVDQSMPSQDQQRLDKSQPPGTTASQNSSPSDRYTTFKEEQAMNEGQPPSTENGQVSQQSWPSGPSGSYDIPPQVHQQSPQPAYTPSGPDGSYYNSKEAHPQSSEQVYKPYGPEGSYYNSAAAHPQSEKQVHQQLPEIPTLRESAQQTNGKQFNPETAFPGASRPLQVPQEQVNKTPHTKPVYTQGRYGSQGVRANVYKPAYQPHYTGKQYNRQYKPFSNQPVRYPRKHLSATSRSPHYMDPCQHPGIAHSQTCKIRNGITHQKIRTQRSTTNPTARVTSHGAIATLGRRLHTPHTIKNNKPAVRSRANTLRSVSKQGKNPAQRVLHMKHTAKNIHSASSRLHR